MLEGKKMKGLTGLQEKVLKHIFSIGEMRRHFYLTGGTALSAYHLHHRISDDLDLFTHTVDLESIDRTIEDALESNNITFSKKRSSPKFRRYIIQDQLQLDIVRDIDFRVGAPELRDKIMVDNIKNIAVNKVLAIYGRLDPKDYVDLFFIIKSNFSKIDTLFELASKKDAGFELFQWAKIIADTDSISTLPRMLVPLDLDKLKLFYKDLRGHIIETLRPK